MSGEGICCFPSDGRISQRVLHIVWEYDMRCLAIILFLLVINTISHSGEAVHRFKESKSKNLQFSPSCKSCEVLITGITWALKVRVSESVILEAATVICKLFAKQSWAICDGITGQFRKEFFYVFRHLSSSSPAEICGLLISECSDPNDPAQAGWRVALPPKTKNKRRIKKVKKVTADRPLRVLQLSDLHIDFSYKEGSEANCGQPVCCHQDTVPGLVNKPAGYWGTLGDCDVPLRTVENMLWHINGSHEIDYVMLSGDYIHHMDWKYNKEEHIKVLETIGALVEKYFPNTPVYWALGNHEGVPVNSFAPHTVAKEFWPTWLYDEIGKVSDKWMDKTAIKNMHYRGSYMMKVHEGLRLVTVNTGFCETTNFFLYINQSDPDGTMTWLVNELYMAELAGDSVHILAHIPPGDGECLEGWARNYYRVVQRFSSTITGQFFGHVHLDYFTVFYEDMHDINSKPIGVAYAAPSVTTFSNVNPSYRIYQVDQNDKYKILDIINYSADVSKANETVSLDWKVLYSAKSAYNMSDFSPESWEKVIRRLYEEEDLMQDFARFAYRVDDTECGLSCENGLLCSLRMGHHNSSLYCPTSRTKSFLNDNRIHIN